MPEIGEVCRVTGKYRCRNCGETAIYKKSSKFPPCGNEDCPDVSSGWESVTAAS